MRRLRLPFVYALACGTTLTSLWSATSRADTRICVDVNLHEVTVPQALPPPPQVAVPGVPGVVPAPPVLTPEQQLAIARREAQELQARASMSTPDGDARGALPLGQNPIDYLKRLVAHFITHERGFQAVDSDCQEHMLIELYPLAQGHTIFVRYSGTGREERVDQLFTDELSQFAERAVLALLYGKPISTTIKRDTVLRADSKRQVQRIRGTNHFTMHLGTELRGGYVPTVLDDHTGAVSDAVRVFSPMTLGLGYRGKFESWGVESTIAFGIGTSKTGLADNTLGGHVDYGGNMSLSLHFLRYLNPRGLSSFYLGGGSSFEMLWLWSIKPEMSRASSDRSTLISGGLDVDLLMGVEFMRASRAQFFLQGALVLPAYLIDNEEGPSRVRTWLPGISLKLGMMF